MPAGMLYRWEERNHGLEHKCGTCATVLSSPRAKKTCFGIHEEVCTRYHKTLFYVGQSHHCDACHKTIELHDKRHREIATLIQDVHRLDGYTSNVFNSRGKSKIKNKLKMNLDALRLDAAEAEDDEREVNWDNNSSTLNEEDAEERKQNWNDPLVGKAAKAERKIAKNQIRFDVITKEDLENIQIALHPVNTIDHANEAAQAPNGQGLIDNSTIDKNIVFNANCFRWSSFRQSVHEKKVLKNNRAPRNVNLENPEQIDEILTLVFKRLGIKTNLAEAAKARKVLDSKLRNAILKDLAALENEQAETMQRMAGYWRYANRRTYNQMVENNELWDWATGAKLPKVEEEIGLGAIQEEDESLEGTSDGGTVDVTPTTSPESCGDDSYELGPEDSPLFPRTMAYEEEDGVETPTAATHARHGVIPKTSAETTRSGLQHLHIRDPTYSPGRSPGPTRTFTVPSPSPSDDDPYDGDWQFCENPTKTDHIIPKPHKPARNPLSPKTPNSKRTLFAGKKDTRTPNKAAFIREASPPQTTTPDTNSPWPKAPPPLITQLIPPPSTDIHNHFGNLDRDIPAPCDDPKIQALPPPSATKTKVLNIVIPPQPAPPVLEEGWEIQGAQGKINKKEFSALDKMKTKTKTPKSAGGEKGNKTPAAPKKKKGTTSVGGTKRK